MTESLAGRKVVVLGASSGIGKAFGLRAIKEGADVLFTARRQDRLDGAVAEAGGGHAVAVDVGVVGDCARLGEEASRLLGSVDVVLSSVGTAPLKLLADTTAEDWMTTLQTNVIGVSSAVAALLPSLADGAMVLALSSEAVQMPRWAMGAYGASKAALEAMLRTWRVEQPRYRFGTVGIGSTFPTEFGGSFDRAMLGAAMDMWTKHGQAQEAFMDPEDVAAVLLGMIASLLPCPGVNMEHTLLRTPAPVVGSSELMQQAAFGG
jgi:NAD(P)-dependent dehydrogenase (short-subunit alcohol dehydrogenase family)